MTLLVLLTVGCEEAPAYRSDDPEPEPRDILTPGAFEGANLLVTSFDTTRADIMAAYGATTSMLLLLDERLAESGFIASHHYSSAAWTYPSFASIGSGKTAVDLGGEAFAASGGSGQWYLPGEEVLLAEVLAENGYDRSLLLTSNDVFGPNWGLTDGFGEWQEYTDDAVGLEPATDMLRAWIDTTPEPWVAWLHMDEPHNPYLVPAEFLDCPAGAALPPGIDNGDRMLEDMQRDWPGYDTSTQENALAWLWCHYDGELRRNDAALDAFLEAMEQSRHWENTLVAVLADHGESFQDRNGDLGHGSTVFAEQTRVPLAFLGGGLVAGTYEGPTDHSDVAPTILSSLGIPVPDSMTGVPIGQATADRVHLAYACSHQAAAMNESGIRVIYERDRGLFSEYDTRVDPRELTPWFHVDPALAEAAQAVSDRADAERWCDNQ